MKRLALLFCVFLAVFLVGNIDSFAANITWDGDPASMVRTFDVSADVQLNGGIYNYNYTVTNTSDNYVNEGLYLAGGPFIVDFEIPLGDLNDVSDVSTPDGWDYFLGSASDYFDSFGVTSPFGSEYLLSWYRDQESALLSYIAPTGYIQWVSSTCGYDPSLLGVVEPLLGGFSFKSSLAPDDGTITTSWTYDELYFTQVPFDNTLSGESLVPSGSGAPVPEPATMLLLGTGILGLAGFRRRFRKK